MLLKWKKSKVPSSRIKKIPLEDNKSWLKRLVTNQTFHLLILLLGLTLPLTYLVSPVMNVPKVAMNIGEISPIDVKAPTDYQVEDKSNSINRQMEAEARVPAVYDFDNRLFDEIDQKLEHIFGLLQAEHAQLSQAGDGKIAPAQPQEKISSGEEGFSLRRPLSHKWEHFLKSTSLPLSAEEYQYLFDYPTKPALQASISRFMKQIMERGILGNLTFLHDEDKRGLIRRDLVSGQETTIHNISEILDEEKAEQEVERVCLALFSNDQLLANLVSKIAAGLIYPNLTLNLSETLLRKRQAIANVKPSFFQIKKGEMIIREGEKISENHLAKLNELLTIRQHENVFLAHLGVSLLILITLVMLFFFIQRHHPKIVGNFKNLLLLALIIVVTIFFQKIFLYIANGLSATLPQIDPSSYFYAFPYALAAMLTGLLLNTQVAVMVAAIVAMLCGFLLGKDFNFVLVAFFGGLAAVYGLVYMARRTAIVRGGVIVSLVNLCVIIPINLLRGTVLSSRGLFDCFFGIIGGLMVATLVSALLPVFESLFKLTTDIKLLELSNMNQPILRRLATEAPGTYHHSIIVGNLAESACEAIGANSLLARVAASYHDIGKIKKPRYFVENQMNFKNEHEKLSPSMSGLILISHVKDGVELAKQYKLSPAIQETISQHHGTSLQKFFYQKAKDQEERDGQKTQVVKEEYYRYPGPKPQTKEAGIIMLADAAEAASRTLTDPSPSRLKGLILTIITNVFNDGQLDECELTLKDLHQIAQSFTRILTGIFHQRIVYPSFNEGENGKREKNGDPNQKSAKDSKAKYPLVEEDNEEYSRGPGLSN